MNFVEEIPCFSIYLEENLVWILCNGNHKCLVLLRLAGHKRIIGTLSFISSKKFCCCVQYVS